MGGLLLRVSSRVCSAVADCLQRGRSLIRAKTLAESPSPRSNDTKGLKKEREKERVKRIRSGSHSHQVDEMLKYQPVCLF